MRIRITKALFSIFIISFLSLLFNFLPIKPLLAGEPIDLIQTNIRNDRFTVSWVTDAEETGCVNYGKTPTLGMAAYDDRGEPTSSKTHHVTITGLSPNTQYYYEIISGGESYDNEGQPYTITTGPILDPPAGSHAAYGQVFLSSGAPASGALVTLKLEDKNGLGSPGISQALSALTDINGWWNVELNSLRTEDLSAYFSFSGSGDNEILSARIDRNPSAAITIDTANDHPSPAITLGWVLNMIEMPWYQNQQPYYTGAAACQMILNYIREGAVASLLTQDEIYNYAHPNPDSQELTPDEIDKALGHFDPYDVLISNSYDTYDPQPDGNPLQGYNFFVDSYDSSNSDALNEYMRDICHWMAFTVTQEEWWKKGALAARPNTPAAVPIFGDTQGYNHWVVIKGAATSNNPAPEPLTNPWNTPDFTIYGFWMKDPLVSGIGQNKYATADECRNTYFKPLNTADSYNGAYIQIAEPPAKKSEARAKLSAPVPDTRNIELAKIALGELEEEPAKSSLQIMALGGGVEESVVSSLPEKKDLNWKNIVDPLLLTDKEAREAFKDTSPKIPILVYRLDASYRDYYLIPYDKTEEAESGYGELGYGQPDQEQLTSGIIIIDAKEGYFKEASWTKEPTRYSVMSAEEAVSLVKEAMWGEREKLYRETLSRYFDTRYPAWISRSMLEYFIRYYKMRFLTQLNYINFENRLVWIPGKYSATPYEPFWEITAEGKTSYVTQEGKVYKID